MTPIARAAIAGLFLYASSVPATAAAPAARSPIDGVWTISKVETTGTSASTSGAQRSLVIFDRGYYSYVAEGSEERKAATVADAANPTDAEKIAKYEEWSNLTGQAGTFTVRGTTLTRRPTVAKNLSVQNGSPIVQQFSLRGKLLTIRAPRTGTAGGETITTLTRLR